MSESPITADITYNLCDMTEWDNVNADIAITDPPFGLEFDGKASNYNRDTSRVVDGYVEWESDTYGGKISSLLDVLARNTHSEGQGIVFSGKDNSHLVHQAVIDHPEWTLEGKLYWAYNFAPYCKLRPAHNVYELYWIVKGDDWYYSNECSYEHCQSGEANLSTLQIKRNYLKEMPKYPTRLPPKLVKVLLEHFTREGDTVFDPLAGSGAVGVVSAQQNREAVMGDLNSEAKRVFNETLESLAE
jgi:DNA modification methylase